MYQLNEHFDKTLERELKRCGSSYSLREQDLERLRKSSSKFEEEVQSHI